MTTRFLILIPATAQAACNALAKQYFDALGGELTFTVPLYAADAPDDSTPSHYWASAEVEEKNLALLGFLRDQTPGSLLEPYSLAADPGYPQRRLGELGLRTARPALP